MKTAAKRIISFIYGAVLFSGFLSLSCSGSAPANSAFAQIPAVAIPAEPLAVVQSLQTVFRSVSSGVLPSVVELDVIETKTRPSNPLENIPFFFFGQPQNEDSKPREYKQSGLGSGVIVRRDGKKYYVLTNNHVAGSATEISVKMTDGRVYDGKLVGADERKDIALVSFTADTDTIPVAVLGNSDAVQTGDICFAMGTPLGYFASVTQGIISATGRDGKGIGNISDFIQTDAAINQGNSGGPLVNIYGEIIGINTWIASQSGGSQGLGFAIPINNIKAAIESFISEGKVTYGWIGVSLLEITPEYQKSLGVENKKGAFVPSIYLGSPASKGGIQCGDFITALNGKAVKTVEQLVRDVGDLTVGSDAKFTLFRDKKERTVTVRIEGRDKAVVNDSSRLWPGFIAYPITDEVRKELSLDKKIEGVVIMNTQAKSPAAAVRLQNGDIVTAVNDVKTPDLASFYSALDLTNKKEIWFDIYSEGHTVSTARYKL